MTHDLYELAEKALSTPAADWLASIDVLADALLERGILSPVGKLADPVVEAFFDIISIRGLSDADSIRARAYDWARDQFDFTEVSLHTDQPLVSVYQDGFVGPDSASRDDLIHEADYDGYERQRFLSPELWCPAEGGVIRTKQRVTFPIVRDRGFVVSHFGIRRKGKILGGWPLTAPVQLSAGSSVSFAPGAMSIDMSRD